MPYYEWCKKFLLMVPLRNDFKMSNMHVSQATDHLELVIAFILIISCASLTFHHFDTLGIIVYPRSLEIF